MVRSAFLPDPEILGQLLEGLGAARAPLAQPTVVVPGRERTKKPPASAATASNPPVEAPSLDEALLLGEVAVQLRGPTSLERRFTSLCTWLEVRTNARGIFVADADGLPVIDAAGRDRYVAAASEIVGVLKRLTMVAPELGQGATTLTLGSGEQLVLIGADTDLGRFSVGVLVDRPLAPVWTTVIQQALCQVATRSEITG